MMSGVSGFDSECDSDSLVFVDCELVDVVEYPQLFVPFAVVCPASSQLLWFCDDVKTHQCHDKRLFLNSAINPAAEPAPLKPHKTQQTGLSKSPQSGLGSNGYP
jgi:hypothetical protein